MCPVSVSSHEANRYSGNQKNGIWSVRSLSDRITETLHEVKGVAKRHKTLAVCAAIVAVVAVLQALSYRLFWLGQWHFQQLLRQALA